MHCVFVTLVNATDSVRHDVILTEVGADRDRTVAALMARISSGWPDLASLEWATVNLDNEDRGDMLYMDAQDEDGEDWQIRVKLVPFIE